MFPRNLRQKSTDYPELDEATLRTLSEITLRERMAAEQWRVREVEQFQESFPELEVRQTVMPRFTWEQVERQLLFLAGTPERRAIVSDRVASIRSLSSRKPEEMVLQELLIEAWVLLDEEPYTGSEEADMS